MKQSVWVGNSVYFPLLQYLLLVVGQVGLDYNYYYYYIVIVIPACE